MSEIRKIRKPLMEKKRRARINDSLEALKKMLLKNTIAFAGCSGRPTKLEKADILEMTVRYMETLQNRLEVCDIGIIKKKNNTTDFVTSTTTCDTSDHQQSLNSRLDATRVNKFPIHTFESKNSEIIINKEWNSCEKLFNRNLNNDVKRRPPLQEITNSINNCNNIVNNSNNNNQSNDVHWRPW